MASPALPAAKVARAETAATGRRGATVGNGWECAAGDLEKAAMEAMAGVAGQVVPQAMEAMRQPFSLRPTGKDSIFSH